MKRLDCLWGKLEGFRAIEI